MVGMSLPYLRVYPQVRAPALAVSHVQFPLSCLLVISLLLSRIELPSWLVLVAFGVLFCNVPRDGEHLSGQAASSWGMCCE